MPENEFRNKFKVVALCSGGGTSLGDVEDPTTLLGKRMVYKVISNKPFDNPDGSTTSLQRAACSKGWHSFFLYMLAIVLAPFTVWISAAIYVAVAIMWLAPDRRIEKVT